MRNRVSLTGVIALALFFVVVFAGADVSAKEKRSESLVLVKGGAPVSTIVVADDSDWWHRQAAGWLQDYIERVTDAKLPIVRESESPEGTLISVGHTKLAKRARITRKGLRFDGCKMVVKRNVLFLLGRDSTGIGRDDPTPEQMKYYTEGDPWRSDRIFGSSKAGLAGANGTCKAVVTFLEDVCGVRWFMPFEQGIVIPRQADLVVKGDLNKTVQPAFAYATGMFAYGCPRLSPAAFANNFRYGIRLKTYGGHSWYLWVPASLFKEHPEYFALRDGKRTAEGNHLCTTNPEVKKLLLKGIQAEFDAGYEWVQLGQSDGWFRCECDKCEAQDNFRPYDKKVDGPDWYKWLYTTNRSNPVERLHVLHNWIAKQVLKSHPGKTVHFLAYIPTRWPSRELDKYSPNIVAEICKVMPLMLEDWAKKVKGMTVYEYWWDMSWVHGYRPDVSLKEMADSMRNYSRNNVIGFFNGGDAHNWGLNGPGFYALGKLLGDPGLNEYTLLEEYCQGVYGEAGDAMNEFFLHLYKRPIRTAKMGPNTPQAESVRIIFPPRVINGLEERLAKAEALGVTGYPADNIRQTRIQLDYLSLISHMQVAYEAYQIAPSQDSLSQLKKRVDAFEKYRLDVLTMSDEEAARFPDWGTLCKWLTSSRYFSRWHPEIITPSAMRGSPIGYYGAKIFEPLTLDFDALAKKLDSKPDSR